MNPSRAESLDIAVIQSSLAAVKRKNHSRSKVICGDVARSVST